MSKIEYASGFYWQNHAFINSGREHSLYAANGKLAANVWENHGGRFTWHTWDENGTGGENSVETSLHVARMAYESALLRASWHITPKKKRARKPQVPTHIELRQRQADPRGSCRLHRRSSGRHPAAGAGAGVRRGRRG